MSGVAALSVDFTQVIAGTGVGVAGVDDFFNGVLKGTGSCGKRKDISESTSDWDMSGVDERSLTEVSVERDAALRVVCRRQQVTYALGRLSLQKALAVAALRQDIHTVRPDETHIVLIYISLLIISCIIEYVTNKRTLNHDFKQIFRWL